MFEPLDEVADTVLDFGGGMVTEEALSFGDIGVGQGDIAGLRGESIDLG